MVQAKFTRYRYLRVHLRFVHSPRGRMPYGLKFAMWESPLLPTLTIITPPRATTGVQSPPRTLLSCECTVPHTQPYAPDLRDKDETIVLGLSV